MCIWWLIVSLFSRRENKQTLSVNAIMEIDNYLLMLILCIVSKEQRTNFTVTKATTNFTVTKEVTKAKRCKFLFQDILSIGLLYCLSPCCCCRSVLRAITNNPGDRYFSNLTTVIMTQNKDSDWIGGLCD